MTDWVLVGMMSGLIGFVCFVIWGMYMKYYDMIEGLAITQRTFTEQHTLMWKRIRKLEKQLRESHAQK